MTTNTNYRTFQCTGTRYAQILALLMTRYCVGPVRGKFEIRCHENSANAFRGVSRIQVARKPTWSGAEMTKHLVLWVEETYYNNDAHPQILLSLHQWMPDETEGNPPLESVGIGWADMAVYAKTMFAKLSGVEVDEVDNL